MSTLQATAPASQKTAVMKAVLSVSLIILCSTQLVVAVEMIELFPSQKLESEAWTLDVRHTMKVSLTPNPFLSTSSCP